jgi:hypothetical protein
MTDNNMQPKVDEQPEQEKPEQKSQQAQPSQGSSASDSGRYTAPGRRPLFRN